MASVSRWKVAWRWLLQIWPMFVPLGALVTIVIFAVTCHDGRVFCETVSVGLDMPSEKVIPEEQRARKIDEDHDQVWRFRYAPTGTEARAGIPYWLFRVMPKIFPDKLSGYEAFGFDGDDQEYYVRRAGESAHFTMPRGTVLVDTDFHIPLFEVKLNLKRVALNCSACHRGEYIGADGQRHLVDGMPNGVANLQRFKMFFQQAAADERFVADNVLAEIDLAVTEEGGKPLTRREQEAYEAIVAYMKWGAKDNAGAWMTNNRAPNGPGRIDPFNAVKFEVLKVPDDHTVATLDFPSLWNQRKEMRPWHHYDGNTADSDARNYGSVIGVGGLAMTVNKKSVDQVGEWIDGLPPPRWPFTKPDPAAVARGKTIYVARCQKCHGLYDRDANTFVAGPESMKVHEDIGTDEERWKAFPAATAAALNDFGERRQLWHKDSFRGAGHGYVSGPLDGIWARAPYLHNGSVPTLDLLLGDPKDRPEKFCRGSNLYDPEHVGFRWQLEEGGKCARDDDALYDTKRDGNHNGGHVLDPPLAPDERSSLLAYLRTL